MASSREFFEIVIICTFWKRTVIDKKSINWILFVFPYLWNSDRHKIRKKEEKTSLNQTVFQNCFERVKFSVCLCSLWHSNGKHKKFQNMILVCQYFKQFRRCAFRKTVVQKSAFAVSDFLCIGFYGTAWFGHYDGTFRAILRHSLCLIIKISVN